MINIVPVGRLTASSRSHGLTRRLTPFVGSPDGTIDLQRRKPRYERNNASKTEGRTYACASGYVSPPSSVPFRGEPKMNFEGVSRID